MQEQLNKIERAVVRIETKIDHHKEGLDDFERRISNLEKRYWTALGAFVLSILSWAKSML